MISDSVSLLRFNINQKGIKTFKFSHWQLTLSMNTFRMNESWKIFVCSFTLLNYTGYIFT